MIYSIWNDYAVENLLYCISQRFYLYDIVVLLNFINSQKHCVAKAYSTA